MKFKFLLVILLLAPFVAMAQAGDGIAFEKGSWKEVLEKANTKKQLIFFDGYTTWCGPCKKLERDVYPLKKVGDFYNKNFVNVKMDMEKGEGIELAKRYGIRAYPTLLFLDHNGTVVHRVAGFMSPDDFLQLGTTALDPSKNMAALQARYDGGDRAPDFLLSYTEKRFEAADNSHIEVAQAYLKTQKDWTSEQNIKFIYQYLGNANTSDVFDFVMKNRAAFQRHFTKQEVDGFVENMIYNRIYASETPPTLQNIEGIFKDAFPDKYGLLFANFKMNYYRQLGDRNGYAQAAVERFEKFPTKDAGELNDAAWTFYEQIEDKVLLEKALQWARKSNKISKEYANTDTVAALYYKLGNKRKALKYAKRAIKIAKQDGEDFAETEKLLEKINKMP